jgi:hypothetical protein
MYRQKIDINSYSPPHVDRQELIDVDVRDELLKKIMMLKSWISENLEVSLRTTEYNYIAKALLDETGASYSNRDLFDLQLSAERAPELGGSLYRERCDFDQNIEIFMNKVGLNWDYWGTFLTSKKP